MSSCTWKAELDKVLAIDLYQALKELVELDAEVVGNRYHLRVPPAVMTKARAILRRYEKEQSHD